MVAPGGLLLITSFGPARDPCLAAHCCQNFPSAASFDRSLSLDRSGIPGTGMPILGIATVSAGEYSSSSPPFTRRFRVAGWNPSIRTLTLCRPRGNWISVGVVLPVDFPSISTSAEGGLLFTLSTAESLLGMAFSRLTSGKALAGAADAASFPPALAAAGCCGDGGAGTAAGEFPLPGLETLLPPCLRLRRRNSRLQESSRSPDWYVGLRICA